MNNQTIKLDLVPGGVPRTINVSQYDTGARVLTFELYAGAGTIDVSGATAKIYGRKPDGIGFEYDCTISGSTVTADCTEQMTAVPGTVDCALTLTDSDGRAQTARFNLEVKPNPLNDGTVVSETDIALLQQAIDASEEALQSAEDAEAWAVGKRAGEDVPSTDDTYHNNSKYWAEQSQAYAIGAFIWKASVSFANIPTTGLTNGDVYNITDAFTTDNRFVDGSGIKCAAGTNIVWNGSLWDILTPNTTAAGTSYDNTTSGATSSNVQGALDEAFSDIGDIDTALGSTDISAIGDGSVTGAISSINTNLTVLNDRIPSNITTRIANLPTAIAEQNLMKYGYKIGDYFIGASGYKYWLADMDTRYGGYSVYGVTATHHCGVIVDTGLTSAWQSSGTASYVDSTLHTLIKGTVLTNVKSDLATLFGDAWPNHMVAIDKLYIA